MGSAGTSKSILKAPKKDDSSSVQLSPIRAVSLCWDLGSCVFVCVCFGGGVVFSVFSVCVFLSLFAVSLQSSMNFLTLLLSPTGQVSVRDGNNVKKRRHTKHKEPQKQTSNTHAHSHEHSQTQAQTESKPQGNLRISSDHGHEKKANAVEME